VPAVPLNHLLIVYGITVVWGFNFIAVATVLEHLPPITFAAIRFLIVLAVLIPFVRVPARGQWPRLAAICLLAGALHFGFLFFALRWAENVSSVAILLQTYVPMTTILGLFFLDEKIGWRTAVAIVIAFGGVLVVSLDPIVFARLDSVSAALVAALCMAAATVMMRGLRGVDALAYQGWMALMSIPALAPLALVLEPGAWRLAFDLPAEAWGGLLYSALAASIVGHGLMFWLVQRNPVSAVTPHLLMAPVFAVVFGVVVWGDALSVRLVVGACLVLGGVLTVALRARRRRAPAATP